MYRERLSHFYATYQPDKLGDIDNLLAVYKNREDVLMQKIHLKYGVRDFESDLAVDDVFENERYSLLTMSWGSSYPGHLLPTDRRRWSHMNGTTSSDYFESVEPMKPLHYKWISDWEIDRDYIQCDEDGWTYAFDFARFNGMLHSGSGRAIPGITDYVRRRRWIRKRVKCTHSNVGQKKKLLQDPVIDNSPEVLIHVEDCNEAADKDSNCGEILKSDAEQLVVELNHFDINLDPGHADQLWNRCTTALQALHLKIRQEEISKVELWNLQEEDIKAEIKTIEDTIIALRNYIMEEEKRTIPNGDSNNHIRMNLGAKMILQRMRLDSLKRSMWFPEAKGYRFRFSNDGIFIGMRDLWVENFSCNFEIAASGKASKVNEEEIITPTVSISFSGNVIARAHGVKLIGEKGTRVPNATWDSWSISTDFKASLIFEFSHPDEVENDAHLNRKWRFTKQSKSVEFSHFKNKVKGGIDLPNAIVKMITTNMTKAFLDGVFIAKFPPEIADLFMQKKSSFKTKGEVQVDGPSLRHIIDADFELNSPSPLLKLTEGQTNMLLCLNAHMLTPPGFQLNSIGQMLVYFQRFYAYSSYFAELCKLWQQIIELCLLKRQRDPRGPALEIFSWNQLSQNLIQIARKPVKFRMNLEQLVCVLNADILIIASKDTLVRLMKGFMNQSNTDSSSSILGIRIGRRRSSNSYETSSVSLLTETRAQEVERMFVTLLSMLQQLKSNFKRASMQVEGRVQGTGEDAIVTVSGEELLVEGPIDLFRLYPPTDVQIDFRISTFTESGKFGTKLEVLSLGSQEEALDKQAILWVSVTDVVSKLSVDVNALVDAQKRLVLEEAGKSRIGVISANILQEAESERSLMSVQGSAFTFYEMRVQEMKAGAHLGRIYSILAEQLQQSLSQLYPEHNSLVEELLRKIFKYLCSDSLLFSFSLNPQVYVDEDDQSMWVHINGKEDHPQPYLHFDEICLMDILIDAEKLYEIWIVNACA